MCACTSSSGTFLIRHKLFKHSVQEITLSWSRNLKSSLAVPSGPGALLVFNFLTAFTTSKYSKSPVFAWTFWRICGFWLLAGNGFCFGAHCLQWSYNALDDRMSIGSMLSFGGSHCSLRIHQTCSHRLGIVFAQSGVYIYDYMKIYN